MFLDRKTDNRMRRLNQNSIGNSNPGGVMLEKVLKRLCPCYFARPDECEHSRLPTVKSKISDAKLNSRSREKLSSFNSKLNSQTKSSNNAVDVTWKGSVNVIQQQPVFAFPSDLKESTKRSQKNLLKPPLYWKKTMKNFMSEGPPVFQPLKKKDFVSENELLEKLKNCKLPVVKHSETVADISSQKTSSTTETEWTKSQSLENLSEENKKHRDIKDKEMLARNWTFHPDDVKEEKHRKKEENFHGSKIHPATSHGVIVFTAAYLSKKKMCIVNIDRLENLSKKGREGNSYYTIVKLSILPSEKYIRCTKILRNCSNPEVKQDFNFFIKELAGKVLRFSVFDASLQKQHEAIGHALLSLEDVISDRPKSYRIKLLERAQPFICPGNLNLSLKYSKKENKFTIIVEKAKNLNLQRNKTVRMNTYVKVTLYLNGEKVKTKKSLVVFNCKDPKYNSTFTFQVQNHQVDYLSVAIAIRLKGFVNDLTIGRLNFGPFFYVENKRLNCWGRVFLKKETVTHWYRMYL